MNLFLEDGCLYSQDGKGIMRKIAIPFPQDVIHKVSLEAIRELAKKIDEELLIELTNNG